MQAHRLRREGDRFGLLVILAFMAGASAACRDDQAVRRYRAPKEPKWRTLGAVVPGEGRTWFAKASGPSARLGAHKDEFLALLESFRIVEGKLRWTAPPGWEEEPGRGERLALFRFGDRLPRLEATIVQLPDAAGGLLANINRWREQLGLVPLSESELEGAVRSVGRFGTGVFLVDLEGPRKPEGASWPASAAPGAPNEPEDGAARSLFTFTVPSGWEEHPSPSAGRVFEFRAGASVVVTLSVLPGAAGGLVANVNRWRAQAGLDPLSPEDAGREVRSFAFLDREGHWVECAGARQAIVCVFSLGPPSSVFLKMMGPPAEVAGQKTAFEAFARSLKMSPRRG